jgi:hypothetical protein
MPVIGREQLDAAVLTCPVSSTAGSYAYDSADRLLPGPVGTARAALRYDALGRRVPSVGTVDRGGDVSLDFAVVHLVASLSQVGRSSAFGLDPGRPPELVRRAPSRRWACIRCSRVAPPAGEQAMQHQPRPDREASSPAREQAVIAEPLLKRAALLRRHRPQLSPMRPKSLRSLQMLPVRCCPGLPWSK